MAPAFHIPEQAALAVAALRLIEAGVEHEIVLGVLRKGGLGQLDSMRVLSEATGMRLLEAKRIVQGSRAWSAGFARDSALQRAIADAQHALIIDAGPLE